MKQNKYFFTPTLISIPRQGLVQGICSTWLQHSSKQRVKVSTELSPDPLISSFPSSAIKENIISVLSYMLHQVICKSQVSGCRVQDLTEFWIVDLYMSIFYLYEIIPRVKIYLNKTAQTYYYILLLTSSYLNQNATVSTNIKKKQMTKEILSEKFSLSATALTQPEPHHQPGRVKSCSFERIWQEKIGVHVFSQRLFWIFTSIYEVHYQYVAILG